MTERSIEREREQVPKKWKGSTFKKKRMWWCSMQYEEDGPSRDAFRTKLRVDREKQ